MRQVFSSAGGRASLAISVVVSMTFALVGMVGGPAPSAAGLEQRFFDWGGDSAPEGRFIISVSSAPADDDRLLILEDGSLVPNPRFDVEGPVNGMDPVQQAVEGAPTLSTTDAALAAVVSMDGVERVRPLGFDLYAVAGDVTEADLAGIAGVADVVSDLPVTTASVDEYFPLQWPLENRGDVSDFGSTVVDADVDGPEAWHRARGAGVVVAVIDSGIDVTHPDLAGSIWQNPGEECDNEVDDDGNGYIDDCAGWDFSENDATVDDYNGHGTHVAGIIAAAADNRIGVAGIAYDAKVMALKIGDESPTLSAAIEAFAYAIDNGARIINASWVTADAEAEGLLRPVLEAAAEAGVLVVAGAGNGGVDIETEPVYPAALDSPALITVGASTPADQPAEFSNYGLQSVDLFAPGEHILSTVPGGDYAAFSGTSMAAPFVAGAAALLWSATPEAPLEDVRGALIDRVDRLAAFRGLAASGGRLNVGTSAFTRLFSPSLMFTFGGFDSVEPDVTHPVTVRAKTIDPWVAPPQSQVRYRTALLVPGENGPLAVAGLPIADAAGNEYVTDETGRAFIGETFKPAKRQALVQEGDVTGLELRLPAGTYAMVMELVEVSDPEAPQPLGDPSAVFFLVGLDGSVTIPPMPGGVLPGTDTDGSDPDGDVTSTTVSVTVSDGATDTTEAGEPTGDGEEDTDAGSETDSPGDAETGEPDETGTSVTTTVPDDEDDAENADDTDVTTTTEAAGDPDDPAEADEPGTDAPDDDTDEGADKPFEIVRINPNRGPASGGTAVTIVGDFPARVNVDFGEWPARLVTAGDGFLVVATATAEPGTVDVTVTDVVTGDEDTLANGYTYVDESDEGEPSDEPDPDPEVDGPDDDDSGVDPEGPGDVSAPDGGDPGSDTTEPETPDVTDPDPGDPAGPGADDSGDIDGWLDTVLVTPEGLNLVPLPDGDPLAGLGRYDFAGALCDKPECPGWVLGDGVERPGRSGG